MKSIFVGIFFVFSVGNLVAQDSLKTTTKPKGVFTKIKPIISAGYKSQSVLNTNGNGSFINAGISINKTLKITYGTEFGFATFGYYDMNNTQVVFENFSISQDNIGFSYILNEHRILHPAFNLKFTNTQIFPYDSNEIIKFRGIKPGIDLQLNINRFFRFTLGAARNISIKYSTSPTSMQLSGNEFSFGLEFSRFKR